MEAAMYVPTPGRTIESAAAEMVSMANRLNCSVKDEFNGVGLITSGGHDEDVAAAVLVAQYWAESERRAEAYRNSPEGKKAARESMERLREAQAIMDGYVNALLKNDWTEERIIAHLKSKETRWMLDAKEHHLEELGSFLAEQFVAEEKERLSPEEPTCTTPSTDP